MKRKAIIPLVLGLAIGLLAVKLGVDAIRRAQASGQPTTTIAVVQAKTDINAFDQIREDMVTTIETTDDTMIPASERLSDPEQVVKRVAAKSIPKGSPILVSMLAPEGTPPGLTGRIPAGFRAASVKIDEVTGVAYQLNPGDWVDVIVVMDIDTGTRGRKETIAEVILQRVRIAAIGYENTPESDQGLTKVKPAKSATLLVREEDVPKLHLAGTRGRITLAMRGDEDTAIGNSAIAYGRDIGAGADPTQPPAPKPTAPSEIFAGKQPQARQPEPVPMPVSVLVFHGSSGGARAGAVEQIMFEHPGSTRILEVTAGAPTRAANTMRDVRGASPFPLQNLKNNPFPGSPGAGGQPAGWPGSDEPVIHEE